MAYSKQWFIDNAFESIGMASYAFDIQPEQYQAALRRLDSQMATWDGNGIRLGWSIPEAENESALTDMVDVPYQAREAIYLQLGLKISPLFGKMCSPEFKAAADQAFDALLQFTAWPIPMQFPNSLPSGAGNKPWRNVANPFLGPPIDPVVGGGEGPIDFGTLPPNNGAP